MTAASAERAPRRLARAHHPPSPTRPLTHARIHRSTVSGQPEAFGNPAAQKPYRNRDLKKFVGTSAVDSLEPGPHPWLRPKGLIEEQQSHPTVKALNDKIRAWKDDQKRVREAEERRKTEAFLNQERQFLDPTDYDIRLQVSTLPLPSLSFPSCPLR